jgi:hypothetical protein
MREVAGNENVARLSFQAIADPLRRIVRLQIPGRGEFGRRVARLSKQFSGLPRAQLAAVPDDRRSNAARCNVCGKLFDLGAALRRQRPPGIHVGPHRLTVMNEDEVHRLVFFAV